MLHRNYAAKMIVVMCAATIGAFALSLMAHAQTESTLYSFTGGADGATPAGALVPDGNGSYLGVAAAGGSFAGPCGNTGCGLIFKLSPDGNGGWTESPVYTFSGNLDGATPSGGLTIDGAGNLYGSAEDGGLRPRSRCKGALIKGCGVIFKLSPNPDGSYAESVVYAFRGAADGYFPLTRVALDAAGSIYGATLLGGVNNEGGVFQLSPDGSGGWTFKGIHAFDNQNDSSPSDVVIDSAGTLYVSTFNGGLTAPICGSQGCGTVIAFTPDGSGGRTLHLVHSFTGHQDGAEPVGLAVDAQDNVFGVAAFGGDRNCLNGFGCGTVYEFSRTGPATWNGNVIYAFHNTVMAWCRAVSQSSTPPAIYTAQQVAVPKRAHHLAAPCTS
jgi:hypothetical protein